MKNIQETLDSLQPYVIGIRYLEGTPLVDAVFKDGWTVPDDAKIKKIKGNDDMNYFMLLSETKGVGLDDLLAFVDKTIKLNIEREKKHELLKLKVSELKDIFIKNPLSRLKTLKFNFTEEDLVPTLGDFDIDDFDINDDVPEVSTPIIEETPQVIHPFSEVGDNDEINFVENIYDDGSDFVENVMVDEPVRQTVDSAFYLDENGNQLLPFEDEQELEEEEQRAARNLAYIESKNVGKKIRNKIELPPKR